MASDFQQVWKSIQSQNQCSSLIHNLTDRATNIDSPACIGQLYEQSFSHDSGRIGAVYTPRHIVDYIVDGCLQSTDSHRPTILDPACGAGFFLLQAFQWLIDRSRKQLDRELNEDELRELLKSCIFGVDLDPNAVEVAKHALVIKLFENRESSQNKIDPLFEDALNDLSKNIICGNSLTGRSLNPSELNGTGLDWSTTFPAIAANGGFDVLIGNPPYRRELDFAESLEEVAESPLGKYRTARMDLWYYFVHRGIELLKPQGTLSFIVNSYWTASRSAKKLLDHIRSETVINEIFDLQRAKVFGNVDGRHMIFRLRKTHVQSTATIKSAPDDFNGDSASLLSDTSLAKYSRGTQTELFSDGQLRLSRSRNSKLLRRLEELPRLSEFGEVRQGIAENPANINQRTNRRFDDRWNVGEGVFVLSNGEVASLNLTEEETSILHPYHELKDLGRYFREPSPTKQLIYSTRHTWHQLEDYPRLAEHLNRFKDIMLARRETKQGNNSWWHLHWPRDERIWLAPKILCIQMAERPSFVPALEPTYVPFSVNVFLPTQHSRDHLLFYTAVLNSRLLWDWFRDRAKQRGVGLEINGHVLKETPIKLPDTNKPEEQTLFAKIVDAADRRLQLKVRTENAESETIEGELDQLVCQLYGIDFDELNR